jgi:hypothetical protein
MWKRSTWCKSDPRMVTWLQACIRPKCKTSLDHYLKIVLRRNLPVFPNVHLPYHIYTCTSTPCQPSSSPADDTWNEDTDTAQTSLSGSNPLCRFLNERLSRYPCSLWSGWCHYRTGIGQSSLLKCERGSFESANVLFLNGGSPDNFFMSLIWSIQNVLPDTVRTP